MKKSIIVLGLAAYVMNASLANAEDVNCVSEDKLKYVVTQIPNHFKKIRENTYLIEGMESGRRLTVIVNGIENNGLDLSIFDRTDPDSSKWYNVSNWRSKNKGCVDFGMYLGGAVRYLPDKERQVKFNSFISRIEGKLPKH